MRQLIVIIALVLNWFFNVVGDFAASVPYGNNDEKGFRCRGKAVCRPTSSRCTSSKVLMCIWCLCFLRIGEASHPGPDKASQFTLGYCNPSGLNHKAQYLSSHLHCDILAVSETHLSARGMHQFRSSLRFHASQYKFCVGGHPVPQVGSNGAWKGVAVLSSHPTRGIANSWPCEVAESARAMVAASIVDDAWVTGGVLYGEPDGHLHPDHRFHNEVLLQHVAGHVCHLTRGFRFVAGDVNETLDSLPAFQLLHGAGFRDLQTLALERFGKPIVNTCKNKTRKDFCFVSPELQDLLTDVEVFHDIFPDHVAFRGLLKPLSSRTSVNKWFMPAAFPWPVHFPVNPEFWKANDMTATDKYANLWKHAESQASGVMPVPVSKNACGRGQTLSTTPARSFGTAPLKMSRAGEFSPHFHGASRRHVLWVRQVRRLQAYVRVQSSSQPRKEVDQPSQMWNAILRARGFDPTFPEWWSGCQFLTNGAPFTCPVHPPTCSVAVAMFETMVLATRTLETQLTRASRQYAKLRRAQNPNVIFKDVKEPAPGGPEVLARSLVATIEDIDVAHNMLILDTAQDWSDQPILCNGTTVPVIHAIWVQSLDGLSPGMCLSQVQLCGTVEALSQEFLATWKERWQRHTEVPLDRWNGILDFARQHLPQGHFDWPSVDVPILKHLVSSKKPTTASGPDGVSIADLKAVPDAMLANFCEMYKQAEHTGEWPVQVVSGKVSSLAKNPAPKSALDFRPVTVLGLLYRCWSSHHAFHALRKLDGLLPPGLAGSRPNRFAGQIWASLLWDIEQAYSQETDLAGVIADIQKAFNHIPRLAIMELCAYIGLPTRMVLGWTGALATMARRFQIRDHVTEPLLSTTGVPEGCALSCVAMMVIDWTLHAWFKYMMPLARPLTYVDDWQVVTTDSTQLGAIMDNLVQFADMFDLLLDERKTYSWAISATGRAFARGQGFAVVARCKNLGAHVQFTRQHTNSNQIARVQLLQNVWPKLRLSASPYSQKLKAILMTAWPKGLHAIAATTISSQWYQTLRAGALKGLRADGAGCNAHIHLGLIEKSNHDPQFWSILQTFWFIRDCGSSVSVETTLAELVSGSSNIPDNSICSTLLSRLQTLGWHVTSEGQLQDDMGEFSLFSTCRQELECRASRAWQKVVSAEVSHRKGYGAMHRADPAHVRSWLRMLSSSDKALFHKVLNGAHFTQDVRSFSQPGASAECLYCGCTDSRYHRFWQCEFFAAQRAQFPESMWSMVPQLPEVLTSFGWSLRPHTDHAWHTMFANLRIHEPVVFHAPATDVIHLFTDGSCVHQHDVECRFAAWSVVFAPDTADATDQCRIVDAGVLPGYLQSAYRAEVFAILRALENCRFLAHKICLWTDCAAVVKRLSKCIRGIIPRPNSPHADLWIAIAHLVAQYPVGHVGVFKVAAHKSVHDASNCVEEWCIRNNAMADRAAVRANFSRPQHFWALLDEHLTALSFVREVSRHVQHLQLAISRAQVRYADEVEPQVDIPLPEAAPAWNLNVSFEKLPSAAARWYGQDVVRLLISWFLQSIDPGSSGVIWISNFQLYVDFMLATDEPGPVHFSKWTDGASMPLLGLRNVSFKTRARWFNKVLREILRHMALHVHTGFGRPVSEAIAMHTGIWALPWPLWRVQIVDRWFSERIPMTVTRGGRCLDSLPLAARDERFPGVVLTSAGF